MSGSILFFRTETTAIPLMRKAASDASQPRICQISAALYDKQRRERATMTIMIRPDGWVSGKDAEEKHGLSTRILDQYGVRIRPALFVFMDLVRSASEIAAFNLDFHGFMVEVELARAEAMPEAWKRSGLLRTCVMRKASNHAGGGKTLTLEQAHDIIVERPYQPRHDSIEDIRAVARIYYAAMDRST